MIGNIDKMTDKMNVPDRSLHGGSPLQPIDKQHRPFPHVAFGAPSTLADVCTDIQLQVGFI